MARYNCDRCGDCYDEDNLNERARCGDDICWKCAVHAELPELAAGTWWCDRCLKELGREDLLKGLRPKPRRNYGIRGRFLAAEGLKEAVMKSRPGTLPWPAADEGIRMLTSWLEAIEQDVDEDSPHFVVPPAKLAANAGTLVFTCSGYVEPALVILDKPMWPRDS
jgi:hypothetical protein